MMNCDALQLCYESGKPVCRIEIDFPKVYVYIARRRHSIINQRVADFDIDIVAMAGRNSGWIIKNARLPAVIALQPQIISAMPFCFGAVANGGIKTASLKINLLSFNSTRQFSIFGLSNSKYDLFRFTVLFEK